MNHETIYQRLGISHHQLAEFCQQSHIEELALFGSVLRDDFRPDSDIDCLVTFAPNSKISLLEFIGLEEQLQDLLHRKVDLVQKSAVEKDHNWIRRKAILASAQVIYESRSVISQ